MLRYSRLLLIAALLPATTHATETAPVTTTVTTEKKEMTTDSMMYNTEENGKFKAGIKVGAGYYMNAFNRDDSDKKDDGNFTIRFKPSMSYVAEGEKAKLSFSGKAFLDLAFGNNENTSLIIKGDVRGAGEFNPHGCVTPFASEKISANSTVDEIDVGSSTQLMTDSVVGMRLRPSCGVVTVTASAGALTKSYEDISSSATLANLAALGNQHYRLNGKVSWQVNDDWSAYLKSNYGTWYGNAETAVTTHPFGVQVGTSGQLTPELSIDANAGYSRTFTRLIASDTLLDSASVNLSFSADADWQISSDTDLGLSLSRDVDPSSVFLENWSNKIGVNFRHKFMSNLVLQINPSFAWNEYGKPLTADGSARVAGEQRNDIIFADQEELSYYVNDWLSCGLFHSGRFRWTNATTFKVSGGIASASGNYDESKSTNLFLAYVGFRY